MGLRLRHRTRFFQFRNLGDHMGDVESKGVTQLLDAVQGGDEDAAERLLPLVYEELRKLAHQRMAQEPTGHTLQATALVHEAYLRLVGDQEAGWESRGHFFAAAAEAMRRILIERARKYGRQKHGAGAKRLDLMEADVAIEADSVDLLALDEVLRALEKRDTRMSEIVKLRFFAGLTIEQTALALGVTSRTVNRDWTAAKAWLHHEMTSRGDQTGRGDAR
jgi:RNA polymerase sigma factor (TIGR02999 family)